MVILFNSAKLTGDDIIEIAKVAKLNGVHVNDPSEYIGKVPNSLIFTFDRDKQAKEAKSMSIPYVAASNTLYSALDQGLLLLYSVSSQNTTLANVVHVLDQARALLTK